jgi:hypothetical protein
MPLRKNIAEMLLALHIPLNDEHLLTEINNLKP